MNGCRVCGSPQFTMYGIKIDGKVTRCIVSLCDACVEACRQKHPNIEYLEVNW